MVSEVICQSDILLSKLCLLLFNVRDGGMPTELTGREEKDIMKGRIERMQVVYFTQTTTTPTKDNVSSLFRLITISRKNDSNLVCSRCRKVVTTMVCALVKAKSNPTVLFCWHLTCQLISLLVELDCWMFSVKHVLENLHCSMVEY